LRIGDGTLQLQHLGERVPRPGIELAGLGIDADLVGRAVDEAQLLLLRLLLPDLEGLGLTRVQPGSRRCTTMSWRASLAGPRTR
jgi:hypothetical protein